MGKILLEDNLPLKTKKLTVYPNGVWRVYIVEKNAQGKITKKAKIKFTDSIEATKFYKEN